MYICRQAERNDKKVFYKQRYDCCSKINPSDFQQNKSLGKSTEEQVSLPLNQIVSRPYSVRVLSCKLEKFIIKLN